MITITRDSQPLPKSLNDIEQRAQSQPISSRDELVQAVEAVSARYGDDVPRPPHWSGFHITSDSWEFWQDQPGRIHDRWIIKPVDGDWRMWRLQP